MKVSGTYYTLEELKHVANTSPSANQILWYLKTRMLVAQITPVEGILGIMTLDVLESLTVALYLLGSQGQC